ncbi:aminotransferase class V-fold PLP-dependent enzyme [Reyranella sp.]|jgi:selenocysteine lyase/cysteine desulfurase|uniref:aminotransferase class V-fold PLP-dependent enzyme n=1 Tax=Reyranella sp. TaxID=1929291 RepID=UPI002602E1D5|nr:aminotransferase class V-fold PLP-dependent enzyme [Reyranella sp.]HQS13655.1 aminotransferase class V-fold PLP-dependent enzyme [Reyranella sp.]HQT10140.1 aminotransferase class V-fold PLP-dependent enzyme [Reyranella sp.]
MLSCQRELFDIPRDVCFLNAAAWSPLPLAVQEAGRIGVTRKGQPWKLEADFMPKQYERARRAAAALIGADPVDVALIPSVGYGVSTAGKVMSLPRGSRVLVLQDDHTSPVLEWMSRAEEGGFTVEQVKQPGDGDWSSAILEAMSRKDAAPLSLVSISSVHWSDGGAIDLPRIAEAARQAGAALLVDATHDAGVRRIDVKALDPDFLIFPTYKWVLGPYGRAFMYVARRRQNGVPLEQTAPARKGVAAEQKVYFRDLSYADGARRYDMGERDHFITLEMAAVGMEMMAGWGNDAIVARLTMLTDRLADGLANSGVRVLDRKLRAPHLLCLQFPKGMADDLPQKLAAENVYAAPRLGRLRISPHVYNDEQDVDRFVEVFREVAL